MKRGDFLWLVVLVILAAILILPGPREEFSRLTAEHPYRMGFLKFAILATMGELAAVRISSGSWKRPLALPWKCLVWGIIGMLVVMMFQVFGQGIGGAVATGYIPMPGGVLGSILQAFLISAVMNLTFGPVFMAAHRISDTYLDARVKDGRASLGAIIGTIDWAGFIRFVVAKTIPFFWIPAHTITFLLPGTYRIIFAAFLSIALGAILAYARRKASSEAAAAVLTQNP